MEENKDEIKKEISEEENKFPFKFVLALAFIFIVVFLFVFVGVKLIYKPKPVEYPAIDYNGFSFSQIAGIWHTNWQHNEKLFTISLRFNPLDVKNVIQEGKLNDTFKQKQIHITFDPEANSSEFKYIALAASELTLNLYKALGKEAIASCTKNATEACLNRSIVTCDSDDKAVILLKNSGEPRIILDGNCMTLQGYEFDLLKSVDKVLYQWYRIM